MGCLGWLEALDPLGLGFFLREDLHCQLWSRIFGAEPISPSLAPPSGRAGRPVRPWLCRCRLFKAGLSDCPRTSSLFWVCRGRPSLRALSARRNCLVSFGGLVERWLVVRRRSAPLVGRWEWGLNEVTPTSWGRYPLASSYSPRGSGIAVHSLGRRSGPTLLHSEAKVSGVGSP